MLDIATGIMAYNRTARRSQHVRFLYHSSDPLVVTVMIPDFHGDWVTWTLPRNTLSDAFIQPHQPDIGDVHMRRVGGRFLLTLYPGQHATVLSFPADALYEFLAATRTVMPPCRSGGSCERYCPECAQLRNNLDLTLSTLLELPF